MKKSFRVVVVEVIHRKVEKWVTLEGPESLDFETEAATVAKHGRPFLSNATCGEIEAEDGSIQEVILDSVKPLSQSAGYDEVEAQYTANCPACNELVDVRGIDGRVEKCDVCDYQFTANDSHQTVTCTGCGEEFDGYSADILSIENHGLCVSCYIEHRNALPIDPGEVGMVP